MKKIIIVFTMAFCNCITVNAQHSSHSKKTGAVKLYDSIPHPVDTAMKDKKWNKETMPANKRKNWPDTMGRADTLRIREK